MDRSNRARIRDGDQAAFEELFDECARAVYSHAFRLVGDWSTAEDVTALTFLEAWRLRHRADADGGSLRPWLLGIATNVARNMRRAARRHEAALARLPGAMQIPDFAEEVVQGMADADKVAAARQAYGSLRRPEQDVIALCRLGRAGLHRGGPGPRASRWAPSSPGFRGREKLEVAAGNRRRHGDR